MTKNPDIGRVCVLDAPDYLPFAIKSRDDRVYYNSYPYMDLYQTDATADDIVIKYGPLCKFDPDIVYPLSKVKLYGREFFAPGNTTAYLTQIYGDDFGRVPSPSERRGHGLYRDACKDG